MFIHTEELDSLSHGPSNAARLIPQDKKQHTSFSQLILWILGYDFQCFHLTRKYQTTNHKPQTTTYNRNLQLGCQAILKKADAGKPLQRFPWTTTQFFS
mmetsp:Transcript_7786/g.13776  ORF Transcript_7786/g.13776 Transcript_7786/m.13776 type:complete len:99 (-) Transcript_7786:369-665(-)